MSTEIAWDAPSPFTLDVVVSAAHIDLMQHTNNVVYLQWLEDVAWAHSRQLGLGPAEYTRWNSAGIRRTCPLSISTQTKCVLPRNTVRPSSARTNW